MIPAVINVFYPGWFPLDLLCLHSSVLCKIPVTSIVPCEYVTQLPYCPLHKKSDARVVKLHSDSTLTLLCVCLFVAHPHFAHPRRETPFHADTGTQKVCGSSVSVDLPNLGAQHVFILTDSCFHCWGIFGRRFTSTGIYILRSKSRSYPVRMV